MFCVVKDKNLDPRLPLTGFGSSRYETREYVNDMEQLIFRLSLDIDHLYKISHDIYTGHLCAQVELIVVVLYTLY